MVTIYWATGTIETSVRDYFDNRWSRPIGLDDFVKVPTGVAVFVNNFIPEGVPPREWAERLYAVRRWTRMDVGGHFAAAEEPEHSRATSRASSKGSQAECGSPQKTAAPRWMARERRLLSGSASVSMPSMWRRARSALRQLQDPVIVHPTHARGFPGCRTRTRSSRRSRRSCHARRRRPAPRSTGTSNTTNRRKGRNPLRAEESGHRSEDGLERGFA